MGEAEFVQQYVLARASHVPSFDATGAAGTGREVWRAINEKCRQ